MCNKVLLHLVCPKSEAGINQTLMQMLGEKTPVWKVGGGHQEKLGDRMLHWSPDFISMLRRHQNLLGTALLRGSGGCGRALCLPWARRSTETPPLHSTSTSVTLHWLHPHLRGGKCCIQNRGPINRGTSADPSWRNQHLNLASWQTLITGKLLRCININMGCLLFSECWDTPQDPAAHPEWAAGREQPRAASTGCRDLCFSSCPTTNPE